MFSDIIEGHSVPGGRFQCTRGTVLLAHQKVYQKNRPPGTLEPSPWYARHAKRRFLFAPQSAVDTGLFVC
jgi:hypothetical protein